MSKTSFQTVAVKDLVESPYNPRQSFPAETIDQLAASIRSVGLLQPLVVRPHPKKAGKFEVLAGERRLLALRAAEITDCAVHVRELDDKAAIEITVVENLLREDLHPLEEAEGFQTLMAKGWDVASIASRFKHAPNWVAKRLTLNKLADDWRTLYLKPGSALAEAPLGVVEGLARLAPEMQKDLFKQARHGLPYYMQTAERFNQFVRSNLLHVLSAAPWKLEDAALHPKAGACMSCPKRSSQAQFLFDDLDDGKKAGQDRCLDAGCYAEKGARALKAKIAELEKEHGKLSLMAAAQNGCLEYGRQQAVVKAAGRTFLSPYDHEKCGAGDKGAKPILPITETGFGELRWMKAARKRGASGRRRGGGSTPTPAKQRTPQQMKAEHEQRVRNHVLDAVDVKLAEIINGAPFEVQLLRGGDQVGQLLCLLNAFGMAEQWVTEKAFDTTENKVVKKGWAGFDAAIGQPKAVCGNLYRHVLRSMAEGLAYRGEDSKAYEHAKRVCELLGWDFAAHRAKAEAEIPVPAGLKPAAAAAKKSKSAPPAPAKSKCTLCRKSFPADEVIDGKCTRCGCATMLEKKKRAKPAKSAKSAKTKTKTKPETPAGVCRVCGCTTADCRNCVERTGEECTWVDAGHTLCSACVHPDGRAMTVDEVKAQLEAMFPMEEVEACEPTDEAIEA